MEMEIDNILNHYNLYNNKSDDENKHLITKYLIY